MKKRNYYEPFILDIVLDVINQKQTNEKKNSYLVLKKEHNYRQEFTNALDKYVEPNKFKYAQRSNYFLLKN